MMTGRRGPLCGRAYLVILKSNQHVECKVAAVSDVSHVLEARLCRPTLVDVDVSTDHLSLDVHLRDIHNVDVSTDHPSNWWKFCFLTSKLLRSG